MLGESYVGQRNRQQTIEVLLKEKKKEQKDEEACAECAVHPRGKRRREK